ncbi:hypothetical protein GCM10020369_53430 [Cryptosporangium minutisporangium]|uniref:Uncharacterized protein n=1 Tax=Cryptosporangium minutisporangium TaxID=113569 RepID=A0ABP6T5K4_9ACTN
MSTSFGRTLTARGADSIGGGWGVARLRPLCRTRMCNAMLPEVLGTRWDSRTGPVASPVNGLTVPGG